MSDVRQRAVQATFPPRLEAKQVLYDMMGTFGVRLSVLRAECGDRRMLLRLSGEGAELRRALRWARRRGVRIIGE